MQRCKLFDQIAYNDTQVHTARNTVVQALTESSAKKLSKAVLFDARNCLDAFHDWAERTVKQELKVNDGLSLCTCPWDNVFVWMKESPEEAIGVHVMPANKKGDVSFEQGGLLYYVVAWLTGREEGKTGYWCEPHLYAITHQGAMQGRAIYAEAGGLSQLSNERLGGVLYFPFFVFQLLHCRGVTTRDEGMYTPHLPRGRRRSAKKTAYKTLVIPTAKQSGGSGTTSDLKLAKHLCRGSFATYTKEKPLFGHYVGMVWRPAHLRGSSAVGTIEKDYKYNPPGKL
jgi:hypothetical protein